MTKKKVFAYQISDVSLSKEKNKTNGDTRGGPPPLATPLRVALINPIVQYDTFSAFVIKEANVCCRSVQVSGDEFIGTRCTHTESVGFTEAAKTREQ